MEKDLTGPDCVNFFYCNISVARQQQNKDLRHRCGGTATTEPAVISPRARVECL